MTQVLDFAGLRTAEKNQAVADYGDYTRLLRDLAQGAKPSDDEIIAVLQRNDKNVDDLETDIRWRQERDKQIAEVKLEPQYQAEKAKAEAAIRKLTEDFDKVREKYDSDCWPHEAKIARAKEKLHWTGIYKSSLRNDHRDPNLVAELEALHAKQSGTAIPYLEKQVESIRQQIGLAQQKIDMMPTFCHDRKSRIHEIKSQIKELEKRAAPIQAEIDALRRKDNEINLAVAEVYQKMIFA